MNTAFVASGSGGQKPGDRPASADGATESGSVTVAISDDAEKRVGTVMGSYRILEVLGKGGMGAVYLAEHIKLERKVALKMLHPQYAEMPEVVRRFFAEARAVNRIFHDHIVEITDFVENESGLNYFIMEYLRGLSLSELMQREAPLPLSRSIGIIVQVCSALSAVHNASIIHRDLKPDNIFITEKGGQKDFVKLLDFGIAKLLDAEGHTVKLQTTAAGMILGTPEYMSPEQSRGKPVDYRTDIYSIGVILYELAAGKKPFEAESFGEMVIAHSTEAVVPPSQVEGNFQRIPRELDELILQCLEKDPQKRPQSTREIEARLRDIARAHAVSLEQFDIKPKRLSRRSKYLGGAALGLAAAAAAVFVFGVTRSSGDEPAEGVSAASLEPSAMDAAPLAGGPPDAALPADTSDVEITFHSIPGGAQVFAPGDEEPLGTTPFSISLERSDSHVDFEFKKTGYETVEQSVSLRRDTQIAVGLAKAAEPDDRARRRARRDAREQERQRQRQVERRRAAERQREARRQQRRDREAEQPALREGGLIDPFADD